MATTSTKTTVKEKPIFGCSRCGKVFPSLKPSFPTNYGPLYKGTGCLSVCRECVDAIYAKYYKDCKDQKMALRQTCRKLDLYWSETVYNGVMSKASPRTLMSGYLQRISTNAFAGKCYDDTLADEDILWNFQGTIEKPEEKPVVYDDDVEVSDDVRTFWGTGYTPSMYIELEERRKYWMKELGNIELDPGTNALIRQICSMELDINRDRAAGKSVDKSVTALNNLLGSALLKPSQRKEDVDSSVANTPLGVWLYRYENKRPLPDIDEDLKDVNGLKRYVFTWMGHVCKMVGIKNGYTRMYEEEVERLRVERPEYDDEDDETLLSDAWNELDDGTE